MSGSSSTTATITVKPPSNIDPELKANGDRLRIEHRNFTLTFGARRGTITAAVQWIENFDLLAERERGLFDRDNHLQVAAARLELVPGEWAGIVGSLESNPSP